MNFLISDTFSDSLSRLAGDEQKAVKTTAFDLQMNPANPGMSFHKLDKAKDKNFWSVRVNSDIRIIVHKTPGSLLLCYVDHHDKAYDWAERRKLETHPKTGAAQIVEIRETVKEIFIPVYTQKPVELVPKPLLFENKSKEELLSYGIPEEWIQDVQSVDEDTLLILAERLPAEAAEALLELATGGKPRMLSMAVPTNPFDHPDAQRRFRVMSNIEELQNALDYPWEKWTVFLHPEQRELVERDYAGPAKVSGSAGTGKTIVALHRAVYLAKKHPEGRVLLTTFSDTLANALQTKLRRLIGKEPRLGERIDVCSLHSLGIRLYRAHICSVKLIQSETLVEIIKHASLSIQGHKFTIPFLLTEWEQVVDAWQLDSWDEYRDVLRLGRKTRLQEAQRKMLWSIFEIVKREVKIKGFLTASEMFTKIGSAVKSIQNPPYDFSIVDESQDINISQLRFLSSLGGDRANALFFAGDIGQRIFQQPFSWKSVGVDVRGRSRTLRINYRTSHQIRQQADKLLGSEITDVDGNNESRSDTISVFNGVPPVVQVSPDESAEIAFVARWLKEKIQTGILPHEIGVFVRSDAQLERAQSAVKATGLPFKILDEHVDTTTGHVSISTMHLAKGLEFRLVVVMACDDEIIPLQERIEKVGDESDLQEVYDTERHLLYVACTRARDFLLISAAESPSEFLDDLKL